ncbi:MULTISPECIES: glycosyltransferase [unclassified Sphingobium]|uniref:glycosyltransferase n=1 Tax=unclassified Sphingobium TaxID=2611147 RepID=UPI001A11ADC7|nr:MULTISPECIES: glycosyltransferase [unclassified Sphingobium]CAD7341465.1 D-inositol-3-phosphate glycosyltransferase [Sphingobium sp. S6]CAD7341750.1 D-inositol-3-phosphate glycosyltransferase [Sphingobium sp. S8]
MLFSGDITLRIARKFIYKFAVSKYAKGFDAKFYLSHYDDLKMIRGKGQALKHYIKHGKKEGRFPNESDYIKGMSLADSSIKREFDVAAYKFYNKDLSYRFDNDEDLFFHYVKHGKKEGRICRFPENGNGQALIPDEEKWKSAFVAADFISWCGQDIDDIPLSREEAIDLFCSVGIEKIWPINFDYIFDVDFVRKNEMLPSHNQKSDAELYRAWLAEGFPANVAPNEGMFLASYLGGLPYPLSFDWQAFIRRSGLPRATTRSRALIALFNASAHKIILNIDLMGLDASWLLDRIARRALVLGDHRKAVALFTRSTMLAPAAEPLCLLGDAHRELGAIPDALEAYTASIAIGRAPIGSFLHAASIHASREKFSEAFDVLRKAWPTWRQKVEFGRKLHEIIQLYFDHQSARAHALYREIAEGKSGLVKREAVDELLTDTLNEIQAIYTELDCLPAPVGGDKNGYVAILANDDLRQCTHYRIEQKALQFERAGIPVKIFSHYDAQEFIDKLVGARAAIFYRVAAVPGILRAILCANKLGLNTYYEVDDLIFDSGFYPDPFQSFEGQVSIAEYAGLQFGVPLFRYAMSMSKGSIASTPALAEQMQLVTSTDANIIIRNGLDKRNIPAITMGANPIRNESGRVRIFYGSGTKAHNADFNRLVAPSLLNLMERYPHVDLVIVGHLKLNSDLAAMGDRIITYAFIPDVTAYWSVLAGCDINLAVLEPGKVADCKSEIKWMEAAVLQIPSILSGTRTYREVVEDGIDGLVANSPEDWQSALERLITDSELRATIGAEARRKVLRDYDLEVSAQTLKEAFGGSSADKVQGPEKRLRILICHVFFAPQSYGGATRVVEDNVRIFKDQYPGLEIGIFCSEDGGTSPGRLNMSSEDGVPVYRLSTPQEADMDWRPFNEDHAEPFERVLDHFQPDIIHFHCIQRLTATIVEVALRRGIPYLVTLHDAWWVSDHQFLVDKDGLLQLPSTDILGTAAGGSDRLQSIARRQRLASLLQKSAVNLAVSAPFAKVYADAGITGLRVVENGTPPLEEVVRSPRQDGRVALGHVGGRSAHKGASLIEATLRRGNFHNVHLTMVDGTLEPAQSVNTIWGATPVTLTAPFPQSQVGQLYGQLDVLLAPSTWPESFGLVTREALRSGLWVVASNRGAIGEEIEDDLNGYVIDVTTTRDFRRVIEKIDADPNRYRSLPPRRSKEVRSMADQAVELYSIYRSIF